MYSNLTMTTSTNLSPPIVGLSLGYDALEEGDKLVALAPITATASYTLYHTSASPVSPGLDADIVDAMGVQTLTVWQTIPCFSLI